MFFATDTLLFYPGDPEGEVRPLVKKSAMEKVNAVLYKRHQENRVKNNSQVTTMGLVGPSFQMKGLRTFKWTAGGGTKRVSMMSIGRK